MRAKQTEMVFRQWGGVRPGSGPKKRNRYDVSHHARPDHDARYPVHVMMRVGRDVPGLRRGRLYHAIRAALRVVGERKDYRVVHMSIQQNHLHLICEAETTKALSSGMRALAISAAKRVNRELGRHGQIFEYRYKAVPLTSPTQTRAVISYVLNNWRRHGADRGATHALDWYASGVRWDGWAVKAEEPWPEGYVPLSTKRPETWLLGEGWKKAGEIDPRARPG